MPASLISLLIAWSTLINIAPSCTAATPSQTSLVSCTGSCPTTSPSHLSVGPVATGAESRLETSRRSTNEVLLAKVIERHFQAQ